MKHPKKYRYILVDEIAISRSDNYSDESLYSADVLLEKLQVVLAKAQEKYPGMKCVFHTRSEHYCDGTQYLKIYVQENLSKEEYDRLVTEYKIQQEQNRRKNAIHQANMFVNQMNRQVKMADQLKFTQDKIDEIKANDRIPPQKKLEILRRFENQLQVLVAAPCIQNLADELVKAREMIVTLQAEFNLMELALQDFCDTEQDISDHKYYDLDDEI